MKINTCPTLVQTFGSKANKFLDMEMCLGQLKPLAPQPRFLDKRLSQLKPLILGHGHS